MNFIKFGCILIKVNEYARENAMFGYVTVCKDAMNEKDYETFRAYYCGLCHAMGKQCSHISRLGLSYDITFLAIVLSSLNKEETKTHSMRCIAHPVKSHKTAVDDVAIDYAANMGVLLGYLKLLDDWHDDRSIKALLGMAVFFKGMKKAKNKYPKQYDEIRHYLKLLSECEKKNAGVDESADCFAKILEVLFVPEFVTDETDRKVLEWFGYNLGRWIYVMDAFADIEEDYKNKNYNPFLVDRADNIVDKKKEILKDLTVSLTLNLGTLASAYELLKVYKNDNIIRHIVYMSLKLRQNKVLGESDGSVSGVGSQS